MSKNFYLWSILIHGAGTLVAWWHIIRQMMDFYSYEGTLMVVSNPIIPHPVTTACFYGGFGFIIALIFAIKFYRAKPRKKAAGWYTLYLAGGTTFAWNFAGRDLMKFFSSSSQAEPIVGCSGVVISNPFTTACFIGATLFAIGFLVALTAYFKRK